MRRDHLLEGHESLAVGQPDEARQQRRHLDPGEPRLLSIRVADHHREVQREVGDVGERVGRVDRERGQHREDRGLEELGKPGAVGLGQALGVYHPDPGGAQPRQHVLGQQAILLGQLRLGLLPDEAQLVVSADAIGTSSGAEARANLLLEARHADLEEVVEVLAEDGQELRPFQEGQRGIRGQGEDAGVELEPRELAVEVANGALRWARPGRGGAASAPPACAFLWSQPAHSRFEVARIQGPRWVFTPFAAARTSCAVGLRADDY